MAKSGRGKKAVKHGRITADVAPTGRRGGARRGDRVAVADLQALEAEQDSDGGSQEQGDAFQDRRDKVSLRVSDSEGEGADSDDGALAVMDLDDDGRDGSSDEDEENDDEDEDLDEDALLEEAIQKGGRMAMFAKQAKQLAQKLKLQQGLGSDDVDELEGEEGAVGRKGGRAPAAGEDRGAGWGASKAAYYEGSSEEPEDEEAMRQQEEEVLRLQRERTRRTAAADYGVSDSEEASGSDEGAEDGEGDDSEQDDGTLGAAARKAARHGGQVQVEAVPKQLDGLTADQRAAALLADAPELAALLEELTAALNEVRHRVGPLVAEVRGQGLATREGLSYLEAKHLLLLQYCTHITFYLLLKAEGRPVKDHPVMARLVEIRAYLEKIRPIDKKLSYQIDKLLRAASAAVAGAGAAAAPGAAPEADEDELAAAPRPEQLLARGGAVAGGGGADEPQAAGGSAEGVYRPPKLNPVTMEGDDERRAAARSRADRRQLSEARRRAARSDVLADLAAEVAGAPEEQRAALPGMDTMGALRMRHRLEARAAEEEDAFIRVPLSKEQAKALKAQRRAGFSTAALLDDFADEVADLVGQASGGGDAAAAPKRPGLADVFARQRVSQKFGADAQRPVARGGDEDLPRRADLGERRARFDAVAAKRAAAEPSADGSDGEGDYDAAPSKRGAKRGAAASGAGGGGEEDEFYTQAKEAAAARKRIRADAHRAPELAPPLPDPQVGDRARPISYEIQKNRGLTPHRRKDLKNPRKKHRIKYGQALVRRKGQVQEGGGAAREAGQAAYGGEATGVKARLAKGRKL